MDNATRSERSRNTALKAALNILSRDGLNALTFDALARESGISKGGLLHQFGTKDGILLALLEFQRRYLEEFAVGYLSSCDVSVKEPLLLAQIAVMRETASQPHSANRAVLAALVQAPELLETIRGAHAADLAEVRKESPDGDIAVLRWAAAVGLAFTGLIGLSPLSSEEREQLFERLLDEPSWTSRSAPGAPSA
ncbi:TetR/AcrR family transcriptional regulator [Paraburkholderia bannensis]|uniref:TetR/AcrR family transcriptional regulator n=1 Tax=Paraburkholderia bannensis TaxID=765414 RepID=UPI002AB732BF|nr:TetR/AcrR family transcriptional regulator [Paraburkholderia bannensis]